MPEQRPFLERLVFGKQHSPRVEREEKVLQYPLHRMNADANCDAGRALGARVRFRGARSETAALGTGG